ncbi:hypothetical protein C7M84_002746 [Penaeus vannamei]|uniref:Cytochrome P450 n=1 Tax=Penaeus vannamei TaxID=6689 RepID=A0A3R7MCX4_PENVA|nr:hypothetical protein C7M84_002746 [Penaeus vannamei]
MALFRSLLSRGVPQSPPAAALCHGTSRVTFARCLSATKEIPGPKTLPVVGVLFSMLSDKDFDKNNIHLYFKKLFKIYGPIVKLKFPGKPTTVILNDPEDMKWIHHCTKDNPVRGGLEALKKARYLDDYFEKKGGITVEISKERNEEGELTSDLKDLLQKWSLETVCLISLNRHLGSLDPTLPIDSEQMKCSRAAIDFLRCTFECEEKFLWKIYPTKTFKTLQESLKILTEVCDRTLREFKEGIEERNTRDPDRSLNMIEQLLLDPDLSHKDVVTFMIDLLPGGTETMTNSSIVFLYLLAKHPHAQAKVQEEVDRVLGRDLSPITAKQINQLSYIRATLKESFRLLPPAIGTNRILQNDVKIRGYTLHKGWNCIMLSGVSGLDESQFPRPQDFVPERWLRHQPLGQIHPFASLPFSQGTRMCIGRRIFEQNMYILIARTLQRYNLEWRGEDLRREHSIVFNADEEKSHPL